VSYITLILRWCDVIVLNVHATKSGDMKDSFYKGLERVLDHFPKYNMNALLGDFN